MTVKFSLYDEKTSSIASVDKNGGLIVSPFMHSQAFYISVNAAATAFQIVPTVVSKNFIITGLLIASDKTFGTSTNAETVTLYEASADDINTVTKTLFQLDLLRNDRVIATGMDIAISKAVSIVAIATDTSVDITISGYYIDL